MRGQRPTRAPAEKLRCAKLACDDRLVKRDEGVRLSWQGKTCVFDPATAAPTRKVLVAHGGKGSLHLGDNRAALASMASTLSNRVTLAYMDPPFLTNRAFDAIEMPAEGDGKRRAPRTGPLKTRPKKFAFDDRWSSRGEYLEALGQRLALVRELLAPHGSVVIHVDPKTSHYVKVLCDEIFGEDAFASEIVWRYRRWPSKTPNFQRVHDVLLRYRKDPKEKPRWNQPYEPLAPSTLATWGTNKQRAVFEDDGRRSRSSTTAEATPGAAASAWRGEGGMKSHRRVPRFGVRAKPRRPANSAACDVPQTVAPGRIEPENGSHDVRVRIMAAGIPHPACRMEHPTRRMEHPAGRMKHPARRLEQSCRGGFILPSLTVTRLWGRNASLEGGPLLPFGVVIRRQPEEVDRDHRLWL